MSLVSALSVVIRLGPRWFHLWGSWRESRCRPPHSLLVCRGGGGGGGACVADWSRSLGVVGAEMMSLWVVCQIWPSWSRGGGANGSFLPPTP
jgi:hypothetical protein